MVQRYARQVNEGSTPAAFGHNYADGAAFGVPIGGAVRGLGEEVRRMADAMQKRQDEWDAATVMNAQNEYMKELSRWMDDPREGQAANRKLGAARGLADDAYQYAEALAEKIGGQLENDAQKAAFRRVAERAKLPYWKGASEYEARQVKEWQDQTFSAAMEASAELVTRAPGDAFALETAREQRANAIRARLFGADPSVISRAIEESDSELDARRISLVAQEDPVGALAMVNGKNRLLPEARAKLKAAIEPRAEVYERQAIIDGLVQQFPQGQEREGLRYIREHYSGEQEERLAAAYKQRMGELRVDEENAEAGVAKQQRANAEALYKQYWAQGKQPTREELDLLLESGAISGAQHRQMVGWMQVSATRADVTMRLRKDPGWNSLTPEQQEERVMREMGVSREDREAALTALQAGILDGSVTESDVNDYYQNGRITKSEAERLKKLDNQLAAGQKDFVKGQSKALAADMELIKIPGQGASMFATFAQAKFTELVGDLDPASKTYRQDVINARRSAIIAGVEASGKALEDTHWFGPNTPSKFGERVASALGAVDAQAGDVKEWTPDFRADNVTLEGRAEIEARRVQRAAAAREAPSINPDAPRGGGFYLQMVENATGVTSGFNARRPVYGQPGKTRLHSGVDIAAPEGSAIRCPDIGVARFTVKRVLTRNRTAGNSVTLAGRNANGDLIEMTVNHMQDNTTPYKVGQHVYPGQGIGRVGRTGVSTGPHMDLKIKVNGKYVDPERFVFSNSGGKPGAQGKSGGQKPKPGAQGKPRRDGALQRGARGFVLRQAEIDNAQRLDEARGRGEAWRGPQQPPEPQYGPTRRRALDMNSAGLNDILFGGEGL